MTDYKFFTAQLRFVAKRTERESNDIDCMMDILLSIADNIDEKNKTFFVRAKDLKITARALAGVAGFLQQHILPEAKSAGNTRGESQVRWTIDTCMVLMAKLMSHAELTHETEDLTVTLPPVESLR